MLLLHCFSPVQAGAPAAARRAPLGAVAAAVLVPAAVVVTAVGREADGAVLAVERRVRPDLSHSGSGLSSVDSD